MSESILTSTKKILGIGPDYDVFDLDIITHINSVFNTLADLGLGPSEGFSIVDDTAVWSDFVEDDKRLNSIRTYMFLRVKLVFDPPTTSFGLEAFKEQVKELEWRLNMYREGRDR